MDIVYKKIDDLIPYVNNPRNNKNAIDKVASSIKNFGFKVPIVIDSKNEIITGHTRLLASQKLKLKEVPCIIADDLTDTQIKAFRIADNKVAEYSEWDENLLNIELEGLEDIFTGFDGGIEEIEEELQNVEVKPELEFGEELFEKHNYIVLYFDNELDWQTAVEKLSIQTVKANDSKDNYVRQGIGRVLRGSDVIAKIN